MTEHYLLSVVVHHISGEHHNNRSQEEGCKVAGRVLVRIGNTEKKNINGLSNIKLIKLPNGRG